MISNFKFRIFIIIFYIKIDICAGIYINFILIVVYVFLYALTISDNLSIYTFFDINIMYLYMLFFRILINLSVTTDFPSLCAESISALLSCNHNLIDLIVKFTTFIYPCFVWLMIRVI